MHFLLHTWQRKHLYSCQNYCRGFFLSFSFFPPSLQNFLYLLLQHFIFSISYFVSIFYVLHFCFKNLTSICWILSLNRNQNVCNSEVLQSFIGNQSIVEPKHRGYWLFLKIWNEKEIFYREGNFKILVAIENIELLKNLKNHEKNLQV